MNQRLTPLLGALLLAACNEPANPLLGHWEHVEPGPGGHHEVVEFTPSTMRIGDHRVTVVYQFRDDLVRVSADKQAIVYRLLDADTVRYEDDKRGQVTLRRVAAPH